MASSAEYQRAYYAAHRGLTSRPQHRQRGTPEYNAWRSAKSRTSNPSHPNWDRYGGRGIAMCEEWANSFPAFLAHIGPRPSPDHTLDRIDNDKGYEPGNVRWATWREQAANKTQRKA